MSITVIYQAMSLTALYFVPVFKLHFNMTFFLRIVDKRAIYRWYNLIRTCTGECD
jgi:hypothetical protein